jgi:hypothetical protein
MKSTSSPKIALIGMVLICTVALILQLRFRLAGKDPAAISQEALRRIDQADLEVEPIPEFNHSVTSTITEPEITLQPTVQTRAVLLASSTEQLGTGTEVTLASHQTHGYITGLRRGAEYVLHSEAPNQDTSIINTLSLTEHLYHPKLLTFGEQLSFFYGRQQDNQITYFIKQFDGDLSTSAEIELLTVDANKGLFPSLTFLQDNTMIVALNDQVNDDVTLMQFTNTGIRQNEITFNALGNVIALYSTTNQLLLLTQQADKVFINQFEVVPQLKLIKRYIVPVSSDYTLIDSTVTQNYIIMLAKYSTTNQFVLLPFSNDLQQRYSEMMLPSATNFVGVAHTTNQVSVIGERTSTTYAIDGTITTAINPQLEHFSVVPQLTNE